MSALNKPAIGYRAWRLKRDKNGVYLRSTYAEFAWNLDGPTKAVCGYIANTQRGVFGTRHDIQAIPHYWCECGLYMYADSAAIAYPSYPVNRFQADYVVGAVLAWGHIVEHAQRVWHMHQSTYYYSSATTGSPYRLVPNTPTYHVQSGSPVYQTINASGNPVYYTMEPPQQRPEGSFETVITEGVRAEFAKPIAFLRPWHKEDQLAVAGIAERLDADVVTTPDDVQKVALRHGVSIHDWLKEAKQPPGAAASRAAEWNGP